MRVQAHLKETGIIGYASWNNIMMLRDVEFRYSFVTEIIISLYDRFFFLGTQREVYDF